MKFLKCLAVLAAFMALAVLPPVTVQGAEFEVDAGDSLTTGVLTVANNAYGEFFVPAGRIQVRAVDDATTATTLAFVQYFPTDPSSTDLDGSTREKTGIAIQEGDVLTFVLEAEGWIGVDGAVGTSQIVAIWLKQDD